MGRGPGRPRKQVQIPVVSSPSEAAPTSAFVGTQKTNGKTYVSPIVGLSTATMAVVSEKGSNSSMSGRELSVGRSSWVSVLQGTCRLDDELSSRAKEVTVPMPSTPVPRIVAPSPNSGTSPHPKPVKIDMDDVIDEIHFWETFVVCFVMGANPPLHVIEGYVKRIWENKMIDKIDMIRKGVFVVLFMDLETRNEACNSSGILFDSNHLWSSLGNHLCLMKKIIYLAYLYG